MQVNAGGHINKQVSRQMQSKNKIMNYVIKGEEYLNI